MPALSFTSHLLTQEQADFIVDTLLNRCNEIEVIVDELKTSHPDFFDEEYYRGRPHSLTAAIYSAFQEDLEMPDMTCHKQPYGRGRFLPELTTSSSIIQIYGDSFMPNSVEILSKCDDYNNGSSDKQYGIVRFLTGKNGRLTQVQLLTLNHKADILSTTVLYQYRARIHRLTA